jgi:hypothetical protein
MKSCLTCNRTFEDTLTYCLVDGSILSAPFDPQATVIIPSARKTDPPPTEVLRNNSSLREAIPSNKKRNYSALIIGILITIAASSLAGFVSYWLSYELLVSSYRNTVGRQVGFPLDIYMSTIKFRETTTVIITLIISVVTFLVGYKISLRRSKR